MTALILLVSVVGGVSAVPYPSMTSDCDNAVFNIYRKGGIAGLLPGANVDFTFSQNGVVVGENALGRHAVSANDSYCLLNGSIHPKIKSPSRDLDPVPHFAQHLGNFFAVVSLDLDHPTLDRPPAAAGLLELLRQGVQATLRQY